VLLLLAPRRAHALIGSELSLEIRGGWLTTSDGRSSLGLLLEINVPFDPVRPAPANGALLQDEQTAPLDEVPLDPLERDSPDASGDDWHDVAWERAVSQRAGLAEPLTVPAEFVSALTAAALAAQGCDIAFARLESLGTRNRASALLPEVSLRAGRERDTALRLTPTDTDPYRYTQSDASNMLLEGRLAWRLGRLLFSSEDLGIERLRLARSRERQRVIERTLAVFFRWMRAQAELVRIRNVPRRTIRVARWEATQAALHLDATTAGWFSAHAEEMLRHAAGAEEGKSAPVSSPPADSSRQPPVPVPVPQQHQKGEPGG
jgi:hypothetical protein